MNQQEEYEHIEQCALNAYTEKNITRNFGEENLILQKGIGLCLTL